jgi:hypothetical protein
MTDLYNQSGPSKCKKGKEEIEQRIEMLQKRGKNPAKTIGDKGSDEQLKENFKANGQFVSVIFIDEFDAIGGDRSKDDTGMTANAVNTMLQMMDGIDTKKNVITVCATNYPWNLDGALLRRFNEQVYCNIPSAEDIKALIVKEMQNRFTIETKTKLEYCATGLGKVFNPSEELKQLFQKEDKTDKATKTCDDEKNLRDSVLMLISKDYMEDNSDDMAALVSELAEKNYSNSDVATVMQRAFNAVAERALKSTLWYSVEYNGTKYWTSFLTKFKPEVAKAEITKFSNISKDLQAQATVPTDYPEYPTGWKSLKMTATAADTVASSIDKAKHAAEQAKKDLATAETEEAAATPAEKSKAKASVKAAKEKAKATAEAYEAVKAAAPPATSNTDTTQIVIPKEVYFDKESIRSIFSDVGTNVSERQLTSIIIKNKTYVNIRYIYDLPTILMFNDRTISDMFYNIEEVDDIRKLVEQSKIKALTPIE